MNWSNPIFSKLTNTALFLSVFIASFNVPRDPDLGWHLKYGEYFFQNGQILKDNIFSSMMSDYKWVNHSWISDLLSYFFFDNFGFIGLTVLSASVVALTFFLFSKAFNLTLWNKAVIFPLLFFFVEPVYSHGFRTQMLSYLLTGVLFLILYAGFEKSKKFFLFLPPLFLVWVNMHGGFILGLILMIAYSSLRLFKEVLDKKIKIQGLINLIKEYRFLVAAILISFFATLVNPFGFGVYREVFNHFGNPWLKYISEWAPFGDLSRQWWSLIAFINLFVVGLGILFFTGRLRSQLPLFLLCTLLILLSFYERRYAWTLYYISLPILAGISHFFKPNTVKFESIGAFIISVVFLFFASSQKGDFSEVKNMTWSKYCSASVILCSPSAVRFVEENKLANNISTPYSWGGWMIWNYPNVKPSIDGRMHLWKDEKEYSAFAEYYTNVQDWESIDRSKYDTVIALKIKPIYKRLTALSKEGKWKKVYEDRFSAVFVRNKM